MRFGLTRAIALGILIAAPALHGGDCDDDPTVAPFIKGLKSDSKNLDMQYNLAIAYYKKVVQVEPGQPNPCLSSAIDAMRRFTKLAGGKGLDAKTMADAFGVLGILEFQYKGDPEAGVQDFEKAIKFRPEDKDSTFGAALAYMKLGKDKEASDFFKATLKIDPTNVTAAFNYATSLNKIFGEKRTPEQTTELKKAFEAAVRAGEHNKKANKDILLVTYNSLGDLYAKSNEVPKAIEVLNKAVAIEDKDYNAHFQLGLLYGKDKNYLKMVDEYEKAVEIQPDTLDARYNLAAAYSYQERYAKAYEQFAYITEKIDHSNSEVLVLQAQTLDRAISELSAQGTTAFTAEDYFTAKGCFEQVLKLNPKDKTANKYLDESNKQIEAKFSEYVKNGDSLAKKKKTTDAAEMYEKALALKPDAKDIKLKRDKLGADIMALISRYLSRGDAAMAPGPRQDLTVAEENYRKAGGFKQGKARSEARLKKLNDKYKGDFLKKVAAGESALAKNNLSAALNAFRAAVAINRSDKRANAGLVTTNTKIKEQIKNLSSKAETAASSGKKADAAKLYNKVLALDPNDKNAADQIKSLTGTEAKAKVNADQVKALYYKGVDYYVNNNISQAITTWKQLLELDPNHEDAKKNIARAKTKLDALAKLGKS